MSSTHAIPASIAITPHEIIALRPDAPLKDAQISLADRQLKQLARMAEIGMDTLEELNRNPVNAEGKPLNAVQVAYAVERVSRAVRCIMALELEISGLREKRVGKAKQDLLTVKKTAVHQSLERSLMRAKPEMDKPKRERLLSDLLSDYSCLTKGTVSEVIAQLCQVIGIEPDLSIWQQPTPMDIHLPAGFKWTIPANGDKPYTSFKNPEGRESYQTFDSPHLERNGADPPI